MSAPASIVDSSALTYPPDPDNWDAAVQEGLLMRQDTDRSRWYMGWRSVQIEQRYGKRQLQEYADKTGYAYQTLVNYAATARRFQPDHVNRFPHLPWGMWKAVTRLAGDDFETAMDMIERAYTTPGLTVREFKQLVDDLITKPMVTLPPFRATGKFKVFLTSPTCLIIGIEITHAIKEWQKRAAEHPLLGTEVEAHFRSPNLGI